MSDPSKTHDATPKRQQDFRKKGDIALSRELVTAASLLGAVIGMIATAGNAIASLLDFTREAALATDGRATAGLASATIAIWANSTFCRPWSTAPRNCCW